jgi:LysR family glycine cleavage system transcriptional activator
MSRRLPPLNALRAFEAAARHLSVAKAAAELNVTPAAVSHQVKALEADLGVVLFRRLNRGLLLTDAGQRALPLLSEGLGRLREAVDRALEQEAKGALTVSVAPAFATKWLVPRVERFAAQHPDVDLRIAASMRLADFRTDGVDVAIRFGQGTYPGLVSDKLLAETFVPMCSPKLLQGPCPLERPRDLVRHTLLHDAIDNPGSLDVTWPMWLKAAGVTDIDAERGPRFSHSEHALQAAMNGAGVVLFGRSLAAADLAAGRLVVPFEMGWPVEFGYFLVTPEEHAARPKVAAFRAWALAEARSGGEDAALRGPRAAD